MDSEFYKDFSSTLTYRELQIVKLMYGQDATHDNMSREEVAKIFSIAPSTVSSIVRSVRKRLRNQLEARQQ